MASQVAGAIWPGVQFKAQGGGAAASRILKNLSADGLVEWTSSETDWGWRITMAGRGKLSAEVLDE